jgi:hypothetical protein
MSRDTRPIPPLPEPKSSISQRSLSPDAAESSSSCFSTSSPDDCQSSSSPTVNVKFAPLPKISPRERKLSSHPIGIAARSRILQQRRDAAQTQGAPQPGIWSDVDERSERFIPLELQEEDPLDVLGRIVVEKSKLLWRRATSKKRSDKVNDETRGIVVSETTTQEERNAAVQSPAPSRNGVPLGQSSSGPLNQTSEVSEQKRSSLVKTLSRGSSRRDGDGVVPGLDGV